MGCQYLVVADFEQIVALSIFDISNMLINNDNTKIRREYSIFNDDIL